jgi:hypothetical protein
VYSSVLTRIKELDLVLLRQCLTDNILCVPSPRIYLFGKGNKQYFRGANPPVEFRFVASTHSDEFLKALNINNLPYLHIAINSRNAWRSTCGAARRICTTFRQHALTEITVIPSFAVPRNANLDTPCIGFCVTA